MKHFLRTCGLVALLMMSGCVTYTPRPHRFVEGTNGPQSFTKCEAWSDDSKLVLDLTPRYFAPTFYGLYTFKEGDNFYVYDFWDSLFAFAYNIDTIDAKMNWERQWIGSREDGHYRFTIDTAKYGMREDWPEHVYWLTETGTYWFPSPRFWSEPRREPAVRKRIEVRPLAR
jgi:hypothetical protein